ncbi:MAG: DUF2184 domain-containing protein [Clostridia bacterium]|nr:DUF2184 domain-containing protein [Clostridia bacterium]MBQ9212203.1 DUF2184 domain-containing protein [Clostridia bacterium]
MQQFDISKFPMLTLDAAPGGVMAFDAGGMAFLVGELERRDPTLNEPLTAVTWQRDMPVKTGGGFVDSVASFNVSYGSTGGPEDGLMGQDTNELPVIQADIGKDTVPVFIWGHILKVPMIDQEKLQKVGRSLEQIYDKGLRLAHDKKLDENVYYGFPEHGSYGLVNDPNITTVTAAPHTSGGTDTQWSKKDADEILADINRGLVGTIKASEYDNRGMADSVLIPWDQFSDISMRKVGVTGDKSILTYLLENNIAKKQGIELTILPAKQCAGAGTGGADRMIFYRNDEEMVRMNITVPLKRLFTQPSAAHIAYLTPFVTQFSALEWIYTTHAMYIDGI